MMKGMPRTCWPCGTMPAKKRFAGANKPLLMASPADSFTGFDRTVTAPWSPGCTVYLNFSARLVLAPESVAG